MSPPASDPTYAKLKVTDVPWYLEDITVHSTPQFRTLLNVYSGIDPQDISAHASSIRAKLWARRTYPCIGLGLFQIPFISYGFFYPSILSALKSNPAATFLDVGCLVGHDLRQLLLNGVHPSQLLGIDLVDFWDIGFELFRDGEGEFAKEVKYRTGDVLDLDSMKELEPAGGKVDIVYTSQVLHQFDFERQVSAAKNLVALSRGPGSRITGAQLGFHTAREKIIEHSDDPRPWFHDPTSWDRMWDRVGQETGTQWQAEFRWKTWEEYDIDVATTTWLGNDVQLFEFDVKRLE
ncbi:MAG: hypothetical protein M1821_005023 [Bathelium mastoideum]|nr:MAG: hypothetical protein M1821_005023 [Bathelium mastoideum]